MKTYTPKELAEIDDEGERADLSDADLRNADLNRCRGNRKEINSIHAGTYHILFTDKIMAIGCQQHSIQDWMSFDGIRIQGMDGDNATNFWKVWKPILVKIFEAKGIRYD
jgi:uncharacterized protein YjbI with pentapeptide repeats